MGTCFPAASAGNAAGAKRFPSYAQAVQASVRKTTLRSTPIEPITKVNTTHQMVSKASQSSIISTSSSVTIVGDTDESGSKGEEGPVNSPPAGLVVDVEKDQSETEASTQICPESEAEPMTKPTLGRLFTDGGLERLLIEVLDHATPLAMARCLLVCKNTNTVMVKSSCIQVRLRANLYGFGRLPIPKWHNKFDPVTSQDRDELTSKKGIKAFCEAQAMIEHTVYQKVRQEALSFPWPLGDIQGNIVLLDHGAGWSVVENFQYGAVIARSMPASSITLSSEDKVAVESFGVIRADNQLQLICVRPCAPKLAGPNHHPVKHPDAKYEDLWLAVHGYNSPDSNIENVPVRLYPGGFAALLLTEGHRCDPSTSLNSAPTKLSTRLIVVNWKSATGLGVIMLPDQTVKILDFRFLNEAQIICSTIRTINGNVIPCIDIYDIPKNQVPFNNSIGASGVLETGTLANMPLAASFQFPALNKSNSRCLWSRPAKSDCHISDFNIRLPRPTGLNALIDQVMTFRLKGQVGGKSERLQGVILLSRLVRIMHTVVKSTVDGFSSTSLKGPSNLDDAKTAETVDPPVPVSVTKDYDRVCFKWSQWSTATSLRHSTSSTVPEPRYTQVASIARSKTDKRKAVMLIRDYNQQMLHAPPAHLTRNLGHPTENCDLDEPKHKEEVSVAKPFIPVVESRHLNSLLFGGKVECGLGHRLRMVDLGEYSHSTAKSRLFWSGKWMELVLPATGDTFEYHLFVPAHDAKEAKRMQAIIEEAEASTDN